MKNRNLLLLCATLVFAYINAQQVVVPIGHNMSNTEGNASITIGYIPYIIASQPISGVQQPFLEQYVLSVKAIEDGDYVNTEYYENDVVNLTATTVNSCSTFSSWSDGNTDNPRTIIVTGDATYTAEFEQIQYTIEALPDNPAQGSATVTNP